ncbi:MAG: hypothetical protein SGJ23_15560 [Alphaproteobacteria bacterium]|nr:hypothetical protein [Alphaproteobacteria bacterium]
MRLAVVVFAISLVACGRSPEAEFADTAPPQMFGQVRAAGTEPFWGLSVSPKEGFVLTEAGAPDPVRATYVEPEAIDGGGRFNAGAFTLTVTQGTCSDGMSDIAYPLNARVVVGDRTLVGCAYYPWGANLTSLIPAIDACLAKVPARMPVTHGYLKDGFAYVRLSASGPEETYDCVYQAGEATVKRAEGQLPGERIPTFYRAPMDDPGESCAPHEEIKDSSGVLLGWSIADGAC